MERATHLRLKMTAIITKNGASAHRSTPKFTEAAEQFALFLSESRSGASHSEWADPTLSKEIYIPASNVYPYVPENPMCRNDFIVWGSQISTT
jgi:hypothetical protein